jgi:hypothetical protein
MWGWTCYQDINRRHCVYKSGDTLISRELGGGPMYYLRNRVVYFMTSGIVLGRDLAVRIWV